MDKECKVHSNILIYAMRYCLGRQTFAPTEVTEAIKNNVDKFRDWEMKQMIKEIDYCKDLGMKCDYETWNKFKYFLEDCLKLRFPEEINDE